MRNLCHKCPHYYEYHGYECDDVDLGCRVYGREFEQCPSFDDGEGNADFEEWGCNEKQNRINYTLMQIQKKDSAYWKSQKRKDFKYKCHTDTTMTEKGYTLLNKDGFFLGYSSDYNPYMKGGHRHNHIYNVCRKHVLRSKQSRKNVSRETKKELIRGFYLSMQIHHNFGEFLNKFFHNNKKDKNEDSCRT